MVSWSWIACACSAALVLSGCGASKSLPILGSVPPFALTAQDGSSFDSRVLDNKVWVADFIFTNCPGPCPRMTSQMRRIHLSLGSERDLKLVSFTIDPNRDTPQVLREYADKFHADSAQWSFLTGPVPTLHHLSRDVFMLGDIDGTTFEHSTRFMLVDRKGRIRGAYITSEPEVIPHLIDDIKLLLKEPR